MTTLTHEKTSSSSARFPKLVGNEGEKDRYDESRNIQTPCIDDIVIFIILLLLWIDHGNRLSGAEVKER